MAVRDTLNKIENLVASASHLPLTGKALIDEDDLLHLIDEFRNELPQELGHAEEIINDSNEIIRNAQIEAEKIIKQAEKRAALLVDENDVVTKARDKARMIEIQAHQQSNEIISNANAQARQFQESVQQYANQVFDQLISNVNSTFGNFQHLNATFKHALQVLQQSKMAVNQQSYNQAKAQNQNYAQNINYAQNPNYPQDPNYPQNPQG